jgi:transposase
MDMHRDSGYAGRLEIVETGRRRRWSVAEKIRIVEESLRGHRQASATARRHDIPNSLLFKWRKSYREGKLGGEPAPACFVPAVVTACEAEPAAVSPSATGGRMEIVLPNGRRVIVGADVDAAALAGVLDVLEGRR